MPTKLTYKISEIHKTRRYKDMVETGRYDVSDPPVDELVCQWAWLSDKVEECRSVIDNEGVMVDGLHGPVQNPAQGSMKAYMGMQGEALKQLKQLMAAKPEQTDELGEFLGA